MPKENHRSNIINEEYMNVLGSFKSRVISTLTKVKSLNKHLSANRITKAVVQGWSKLVNKKHLFAKTY